MAADDKVGGEGNRVVSIVAVAAGREEGQDHIVEEDK